MTLRAFYGFDDTVPPPDLNLSGGGAVVNTNMRTGAGALGLQGTAALMVPVGLSSATVFIGKAFWASAFSAVRAFTFQEGATVHVGVGFDASGHITIYGPANTVVATSTAVVAASTYAYIETKVVVANSGGTVDVYLDGVLAVNYIGDTQNAGTGVINTIGARSVGGGTSRIDDVYILDAGGSSPFNTYLGDIVVRTLLPNGNGASSQWTGSDGNSTDNYLLVDEANSSSADYVGAAAASLTDTYALQDIPTTDLPLATQHFMYAAKSDGGVPPVMKAVTRGDGGTVLEETAVTLSTTYQVFNGAIRILDPDGDALTATNVNAMQAGVRSA